MSELLKRRFVDQIKVLFGAEPTKPKEISPAAQTIHFYKKGNRDLIAEKLHARAHAEHKNTWRNRFVGFHLIDLNSALQVMLAHKHIINNLLIGTGTVLILWVLLGGRTFCSWVCPYHLLAEWAEKIHVYLAKKKLVTDQTMDRRLRTVFWIIFALLALATGYTVFEAISPTGILSRALIYGPGLALLWVLALLFASCVVPLRLPDRADLRRRRHRLAGAHHLQARRLLPRRRLPQGLPRTARAGHGDQGPRRREGSAHRP